VFLRLIPNSPLGSSRNEPSRYVWRETAMNKASHLGEVQTAEVQTFCATSAFAGAPLDVIKVVAAGLMVVDHVNYVFFGHVINLMWYLGRPVFPLFVFALVCNVVRGTKMLDYLGRLVLVGLFAQPIYATLMATGIANTLFTLAAGAVAIVALRAQRSAVQHLVFLAAVAFIFVPIFRAQDGLDYGIAGILFPAALYFVLTGQFAHGLWLALLLFALNWYPVENPWKLEPIQAALVAGGGALLIALCALWFRKLPRFLPHSALYIFYPAHLLVLFLIHRWV